MDDNKKAFTSVSPSAKSLLMMKGYTAIPYAKELAALMQGPEIFELTFDDKDFWFWMRVMHFESRYWSIDQLLQPTPGNQILELSSGYSLRGLDLCGKNKDVHYIDTDLPEVVAMKQRLIAQLPMASNINGNLELLPLNALDVTAFENVVSRFSKGPIQVVNEGLLMYLNTNEKKALCKNIHNALQENGGIWITADIYIKLPAEMVAGMRQSKGEAAFFDQHHIEDNKFDSFDAARAFFKEQGFEVVAEAAPKPETMAAYPHVLALLPDAARNSNQPPPKIQTTWQLQAI